MYKVPNMVYSLRHHQKEWGPPCKYWMRHNPSGAKLWIANGAPFCAPEGAAWSWLDKWMAWRAYRHWCRCADPATWARRDKA